MWLCLFLRWWPEQVYELFMSRDLFCPKLAKTMDSDDRDAADKAEQQLFASIKRGIPAGAFEGDAWDPLITAEAVDFIRKLMTVDPLARMNATEALAHPWLTDPCIGKGRPATRKQPESKNGKEGTAAASHRHAISSHYGPHYCELMAGMAALEAKESCEGEVHRRDERVASVAF